MAVPITPDMYATRIREMLDNASRDAQCTFDDDITQHAIVKHVLRKAFIDGVEIGRTTNNVNPSFLCNLYVADGT